MSGGGSTIGLLINDQHYHDQAPISTTTFFEGALPREFITARVQAVLAANPWLAGRLHSKSQLVVPEAPTTENHLSFVTNEALRSDQTLSAIDAIVGPLLAPSGEAALSAPLWHVTVVESAAQSFAMVISLSHVLADGYTYYSIYSQLGETESGAEGDDEPASSPLVARRLDDFGMMLNFATAKRKDEWPRQPRQTGRPAEGPLPRGAWLFSAEWIAAEKRRALESDGGGGVDFVSTNDVVCSWIFRSGAYDVGIVSSNLRGRMSGLKPSHAGNYEAGLQLDKTEFETPAAMRRAVAQLAIPKLKAGPPPDGYAYARAIVTTSTSHFRPLLLPGCTQTLHLPIKILPPGGPDTFILFRPNPNELAVLQANPTACFSPAACCGDAAGPVARPLLEADAAAAAVASGSPPAPSVPSVPPSAPGTPVPGVEPANDLAVRYKSFQIAKEDLVIDMAYSDEPHEAPLAAANIRLFDRIALPTDHRGGRSISAPADLCERLHTALLEGFERAEAKGEPGGLHVAHGGQAQTFWGFDTYKAVQAPLDSKAQRKVTTMLPVSGRDGEQWKALLSGGIDGLDELFACAKAAANGLSMLSCFVLRQDSAQARFVWHQDNNFPHVKLTMVYLLTSGSSTMRIAGFDSFVYERQGCGVAFPSEAHHRSGGCTHRGTMKVTFFFGEEVEQAALLYTRHVARNFGGANVAGSEMWRDRDWDR